MKIRALSSLSRLLYSPTFWDDEDATWPSVRMNDGLDVLEDDEGNVIVRAAVPGVPADKVEVTFEEGVLRIRATVEDTEEQKKKRKVVYRMNKVTSFDYTTTLPRPIDTSSVSAKVEHGVVIITAKVAEEAKPKRIEVKTS